MCCSSHEGDKNDGGSTATSNQTEENQHYGAILPPSPIVIHYTEVNEVEGAENMGTIKSFVIAEVNKVGEFNHPSDMPVALFSPQPYIPQENRLITVEDYALADSHVGFTLATNTTPLEVQKKLKAIKTLDLETIIFNASLLYIFFCSVLRLLFSVWH